MAETAELLFFHRNEIIPRSSETSKYAACQSATGSSNYLQYGSGHLASEPSQETAMRVICSAKDTLVKKRRRVVQFGSTRGEQGILENAGRGSMREETTDVNNRSRWFCSTKRTSLHVFVRSSARSTRHGSYSSSHKVYGSGARRPASHLGWTSLYAHPSSTTELILSEWRKHVRKSTNVGLTRNATRPMTVAPMERSESVEGGKARRASHKNSHLGCMTCK